MYGIKIENENSETKAIYSIGDTISLILQVDLTDVVTIVDTLPIYIKDPFGNTIASVVASRINDVYVSEWTIPLSIQKLYNSGNGEPSEFYSLTDNWVFPDETQMSFEFMVQKSPDKPVKDNCMYEIEITGISSSSEDIAEDTVIRFTTMLSPFYSSVNDVRTVMEEEFNTIGDFDIVRDIIVFSKQVDLHMRPEKVYLQDQYDFAVRMYVRYAVAKSKLMFLLAVNAESKELDNLKYSKNSSGDPKRSLAYIDDLMQKYAYIIYAGGKDTPFIPKTFSKGIYDPNRTEANRAGLDTNDPYPWTNTTTINSIINLNGNMVELRGTRTVGFLKNRASYPNSYSRTEGML